MEVYLRKCAVIWSIYKQWSWMYACDLYIMTFKRRQSWKEGEWREWWNFLAESLNTVPFMHFVLILISFFLSLTLSFSPLLQSLTQYLFLYHIPRQPHTPTHACHTPACVLTHNPRQFLLLFKGILSESNYISGEGGLNSF